MCVCVCVLFVCFFLFFFFFFFFFFVVVVCLFFFFFSELKAPYSTKTDILLSKKGGKIDIWYYYIHKMWHLTACKISVSLSLLNWIKMK